MALDPPSHKNSDPPNFQPELKNCEPHEASFLHSKVMTHPAGACQSACASQPIRNEIARGFPMKIDLGLNNAISTGSNQLKFDREAKVNMTLANSRTSSPQDMTVGRDDLRPAASAAGSRAQTTEFNDFDSNLTAIKSEKIQIYSLNVNPHDKASF